MKAKRIFTKSEIEAIKKFLDEKPNASVDKQGNRVLSKSEIAEIKKLIDYLYSKKAIYAAMSGSGAAVFGIFKSLPEIDLPGINYWKGKA